MSLFLPIIFLIIVLYITKKIYKYFLYKFIYFIKENYELEGKVGSFKIHPGRTPIVILGNLNLFKFKENFNTSEVKNILFCERLLLSLSIPALFRGSIHSEKIFFSGTKFFLDQYGDGTNTLTKIFLKEKDGNGEPFSLLKFQFSTYLKEFSFKNSELSLKIEKTGNCLKIDSSELRISEIRLDPKNLQEFNTVQLDFSCAISSQNKTESRESAKFVIESHGVLQPFDPSTGILRANLIYNIRLLRGSYIEEFALITGLTKSLPFLRTPNLEGLMGRVHLKEDLKLMISYGNGIIDLMETAEFETDSFTLILKNESSLCITDNTHKFYGLFIPSQNLSELFFQNLELKAKEIGMNPTQILEILFKDLYEDGRFKIPFQSCGSLKDPEVRILGYRIPSPEDLKNGRILEILKEHIKNSGRDGLNFVNTFTNLFFKN